MRTCTPLTLTSGDARAVVHPLGAALHGYAVGGVDLLDGLGARDEAAADSGYRGATLVPWPNRVRGARWTDHGTPRELAVTEPGRGTALHGLATSVRWDVLRFTPGTVTLGCAVGPAPGYPYALRATATYTLRPDGLDVTTTVENTGRACAPYGLGAHPYLAVGEAGVDAVRLRADAGTWLAPAEDGIPTREEPVRDTAMDLRDGVALAGRVMDGCLGGLGRDAEGRTWVELRGTTSGRAVALWADASYRWLMVFTGDTLPADRRRRAVAVEPMTCPPDALNSGRDLLCLRSGQSRAHRWGLRADGRPASAG